MIANLVIGNCPNCGTNLAIPDGVTYELEVMRCSWCESLMITRKGNVHQYGPHRDIPLDNRVNLGMATIHVAKPMFPEPKRPNHDNMVRRATTMFLRQTYARR